MQTMRSKNGTKCCFFRVDKCLVKYPWDEPQPHFIQLQLSGHKNTLCLVLPRFCSLGEMSHWYNLRLTLMNNRDKTCLSYILSVKSTKL